MAQVGRRDGVPVGPNAFWRTGLVSGPFTPCVSEPERDGNAGGFSQPAAMDLSSDGSQQRRVKRGRGSRSSLKSGRARAVRGRAAAPQWHLGPALCPKRHRQFVALTLWLLQLQPSHLRPGAGLRQVRNGPLGKRGASSRWWPGRPRRRTAELPAGLLSLAAGRRGW